MGGLQFTGPDYTFIWRPNPTGLTCNCTGIKKTVSLETEQWLLEHPSVTRNKVIEILDGEQGHFEQSSDTYNFVKTENWKVRENRILENWGKLKPVNL